MIREFLTFRIEGALLGVDINCVEEVLSEVILTPVPLSETSVAGLVNLRGRVMVGLDLRARLGHPPWRSEVSQASVVLRTTTAQACLVVDRIGDVLRAEDSQFEPAPHTLDLRVRQLVCGAYALDRELLLAVDVHALLDPAASGPAASGLAASGLATSDTGVRATARPARA